jgi:hypothetical protein
MIRTVIDNGPVVVGENAVYADGLLTLAGPDTIAAGTILARDSVSLKYVLFVKGGSTNQNGIPKAVVGNEPYVTATAGAHDIPVRVLVDGEVVLERLIIDADGTGANVDAAVLDQLRDYKITATSVKQLSVLDN